MSHMENIFKQNKFPEGVNVKSAVTGSIEMSKAYPRVDR